MVLSGVAWRSPRAPHAANTGYICCCFYACGHLRGQTQTMSWWLANQQWRWCAHGLISLLARCVQHRGVQCCGCLALGCCRWQPGVKVLPCVALLLCLSSSQHGGRCMGTPAIQRWALHLNLCWHQACFGQLMGCCGWPLPCCRKGEGGACAYVLGTAAAGQVCHALLMICWPAALRPCSLAVYWLCRGKGGVCRDELVEEGMQGEQAGSCFG